MPRTSQPNFGVGELDPALWGRVDIAKYGQAAALVRNLIPKAQGGLANRPGTRVVTATKNGSRARLLPFQRSTQETAALVMGEGWLRFVSYGVQATVEPTDAAITNGGFDANISGWTDHSTGSATTQGAGSIQLVPGATGTAIGNMTANGGMGAAFDGVYDQSSTNSAARLLSPAAAIGKHWSGTKKVGKFRLNPTPDKGFRDGTAQPLTVYLEGSSDNFAASVVRLYTETILDDQGDYVVQSGIDTSTAYAYHRVRFSGGTSYYLSELEFWEVTTGNGVLQLVGGAAGDVAATEQAVTTTKLGQEHVLAVHVIGAQGQSLTVQVGGSSGAAGILPATTLLPGWHLVPFTPGVSPFYLRFSNPNTYTVGIDDVSLLGQGASAAVPLEIAHDYTEQELRQVYYAESVDVVELRQVGHPPRELRRYGPHQWSLIDAQEAPTQQPPTDLTPTKIGTGTGSTYKYVVTAQSAAGEESLPTDFVSQVHQTGLDATHAVQLDWTAAPGASQYSVYKYRNGLYGFIGSTAETTFTDDGINAAVSQVPPSARDPFDAPGKYPAAVDFFEQREVNGGSLLAPDTLEMSKAASYRNYSKAVPTQSDDAITATISSGELNAIVGFAQMSDLLVFTTGAYYRLSRGQSGLTPKLEGGIKFQSAVGASPMRPIVVKNAALFVDNKAQGVHAASYDYQSDTYQPEELSLTARHLLEGRQAVEWCYQRTPWPILWIVRDDGLLLSLTYMREQQVVGWAWHDTRGQVESACCVSEGTEHAVYLVVRRYLGGSWHRYVERFASRITSDIRDAYHVDCGVTVEQAAGVFAVTLGNPFVVTAPGHGCAVGDLVEIADVMKDPYPPKDANKQPLPDLASKLNYGKFLVQAVSGDDLALADQYAAGTGPDGTTPAIDATGWPVWLGGGKVRRCFSTLTAAHLAGETVALLCDGEVQEPRAVAGDGTVTLDGMVARAHVGLPYVSDLETLPLALPPDQYGQRKRVPEALLVLNGSRGVSIGPSFSDLVEMPAREEEEWGEPGRPVTGQARITTPGSWGDGGQLCLRQSYPLPLEVLSIVPSVEIGG